MKEYIEKSEAVERALYTPIMSSGPVEEKDIDAWTDGAADAQEQIAKSIGKISAADVVEVVRCKDCKHRGDPMDCPMCHEEYYFDEDDGGDYFTVDQTVDGGFCHAGEIKEDIK